MKKILLIGKLNEITQSIYSYLQTEFSIQISMDNIESVRGMVRINKPDLVIASLVGMDSSYLDMFIEIQKLCVGVPLIVIGTVSEYRSIHGDMIQGRVEFLERPVSNEKIMTQCKKHFGEIAYAPAETTAKSTEKTVKTIMMVDDSAMALRSMKRILEPKYKTVLVSNGSQAISQITKHKPDLIILDYEMPVCNGERIFKLLKASDSTKDIPVIFLTGVTDKENVMSILKLNPAGYFLKPPAADKLLKAIEDVFDEGK